MRKVPAQKQLLHLLVGSIGVVYGDIGTSPLYALKSCFTIGHLSINEANILGIISLFVWCLLIIVSFKYVHIVLKMDHQGEGGTLALSTLVATSNARYRSLAVTIGIIGAALFFGDGIMTPAISVLSAVEGITVISPRLAGYIMPATVLILLCLFGIQKFGSSRIGRFFGPVMIVWFVTLLFLGIYQICRFPMVLKALNPYYALHFLLHNSWTGLSVMGGVILVVTGVEALYADLGHFGEKPIKLSWSYFVCPALICNYLGQGALLLLEPKSITNPFYLMAPNWALNSLIILATLATIIASQSILSGLFSITYHSILLNYLPRLKVDHTSESFRGQIYIPIINRLICVLTIGAILKFGSSDNMAVAYGLCAASIMLMTTILIFLLAWNNLHWHKLRVVGVFIPLVSLDFLFVSTNLVKFFEGAWYVILITGIIYYCMHVWIRGSKAFAKQKIVVDLPLEQFIQERSEVYTQRIPGTALFFCLEPFKVPSTLVMNLQHNKYLHAKIILISFINLDTPYHDGSEYCTVHNITDDVFQVAVKSGFMEKPNINRLLMQLKQKDVLEEHEDISIFLSRDVPLRTEVPFWYGLQKKLYFYLFSIAQNATDFYRIPHDKVIELGIIYKI